MTVRAICIPRDQPSCCQTWATPPSTKSSVPETSLTHPRQGRIQLAVLVSIPEPPQRDRSCKRLFQSTTVVRLGDEDRLAFFAWRCGCVRTQISSQRLPHCPRHLSSLVSSSITPPHSGQMQFRIADLTSSAWVVRVSNILLLRFTKGPVKRSLIASLLSVAHRRPLEFVIKSGADPPSFQVLVCSIRRIQCRLASQSVTLTTGVGLLTDTPGTNDPRG